MEQLRTEIRPQKSSIPVNSIMIDIMQKLQKRSGRASTHSSAQVSNLTFIIHDTGNINMRPLTVFNEFSKKCGSCACSTPTASCSDVVQVCCEKKRLYIVFEL